MTQIEKEIEIKKIAKRLSQMVRELELCSLDIAAYSGPLSKGLFPTAWHKDAEKALDDYVVEMQRISARFKELFNEELGSPELEKPIIKRRKKK